MATYHAVCMDQLQRRWLHEWCHIATKIAVIGCERAVVNHLIQVIPDSAGFARARLVIKVMFLEGSTLCRRQARKDVPPVVALCSRIGVGASSIEMLDQRSTRSQQRVARGNQRGNGVTVESSCWLQRWCGKRVIHVLLTGNGAMMWFPHILQCTLQPVAPQQEEPAK